MRIQRSLVRASPANEITLGNLQSGSVRNYVTLSSRADFYLYLVVFLVSMDTTVPSASQISARPFAFASKSSRLWKTLVISLPQRLPYGKYACQLGSGSPMDWAAVMPTASRCSPDAGGVSSIALWRDAVLGLASHNRPDSYRFNSGFINLICITFHDFCRLLHN